MLGAVFVCAAFTACSHEENSEYYTVSYSTERGTPPASVAVEDGTVLTDDYIPLLQADGYDFAGWYVGTERVTAGAYTVRGDVTLYAHWTAHTYTVAFDANEGTGSMEAVLCTYDVEQPLPDCTFTRDGYGFLWWSTEKDGTGTLFADGERVKNIIAADEATVTLYAQWWEGVFSKGVHNITYVLNGGTNAESNKKLYAVAVPMSFADAIRTGYDFAGWYTSEDFADGTNITSTEGKTESLTVYAKWQPTPYTITYELNGGTNAETNKTTYTVEDTVTFADAMRTGYDFAGWYTSEDFADGTNITSTAENTGSLTVYARWARIYTVSYELGGGTNAETNETAYSAVNMLTFSEPTRTGYDFISWNTAADGTGATITDTADKAENLTLYAVWKCVPYTITYKNEDGSDFASWYELPATYTIEDTVSFLQGENATEQYAYPELYTAQDFSGEAVAGWETGTTGDKTLYVHYVCTASTAENTIKKLTGAGPYTVAVRGAITDETIQAIADGINAVYVEDDETRRTLVALDMAEANGVDTIAGQYPVDIDGNIYWPYKNFYACKGLYGIVLPTNISSIGICTFENCSNLTFAIIPANVVTIWGRAFSGCSSLMSIELPSGLTTIGGQAFYGCTDLTSVGIPNTITSIGTSAFVGCSSLTSVRIPSGVTSIEDFTFYGCTCLTSVEIPNTITSIGISAFNGCSSLTSVRIPSGVTSIENLTFYGCTCLTSVEIPNTIASIGTSAFNGCSSLTSVEIPNSVISIGSSAFAWCASLTSANIPTGITVIEEAVFCRCSNLTALEIPSGVTSIGKDAFYACSNLTSLEIPSSVTSIGAWAFCDCSGLPSLKIPGNVITIGKGAFHGCRMTAVTIPISVTSIGADAFFAMYQLKSLTFEDANNWYCTDSEEDWEAKQNGTLITDTSTLSDLENFNNGKNSLYFGKYLYKLSE